MQHGFSPPSLPATRPPQSHSDARRHTTLNTLMTETKTVKALRSPLEIPTRPGGTIQARHPLASGRIEVSNDQSIRDSQSPRRLPDSGGGFSQPEENACVTTAPTLRSHHVKLEESAPLEPWPDRSLGDEGFRPYGHPRKPTTAVATGCAGGHIDRPRVRRPVPESPGRHYLPGLIEPPVGIEPTTYSLRVNRSAD